MSNSILRIAAGVIGLAVVAFPHMASAQTYRDDPGVYHPYMREDFGPARETWGDEHRRVVPRLDDRRADYGDEEFEPRRHHHHHHDADLGGYGPYGGPDHWRRWDRPVGLPFDDGARPDRFPLEEYRPVVLPARPVYGAPPRDRTDLGCTVQTGQRENDVGERETVTRRSCYAR